jgi:hypothetical protein
MLLNLGETRIDKKEFNVNHVGSTVLIFVDAQVRTKFTFKSEFDK